MTTGGTGPHSDDSWRAPTTTYRCGLHASPPGRRPSASCPILGTTSTTPTRSSAPSVGSGNASTISSTQPPTPHRAAGSGCSPSPCSSCCSWSPSGCGSGRCAALRPQTARSSPTPPHRRRTPRGRRPARRPGPLERGHPGPHACHRSRPRRTDTAHPGPGRTADEAATEAGWALPAHADRLRTAARTFDDVTYGGRPGTEPAYALLTSLDTDLQQTKPDLATTPTRSRG